MIRRTVVLAVLAALAFLPALAEAHERGRSRALDGGVFSHGRPLHIVPPRERVWQRHHDLLRPHARIWRHDRWDHPARRFERRSRHYHPLPVDVVLQRLRHHHHGPVRRVLRDGDCYVIDTRDRYGRPLVVIVDVYTGRPLRFGLPPRR